MRMNNDMKKQKLAQVKWLAETIDSNYFYGTHVDLTRRQVIEALSSCQLFVEDRVDYTDPIIIFNDKKHYLYRTSLYDDVATGLCERFSPDQWRAHYLLKAQTCMGARLHMRDELPGFAIIDGRTDG